jgi:hypothetical protein
VPTPWGEHRAIIFSVDSVVDPGRAQKGLILDGRLLPLPTRHLRVIVDEEKGMKAYADGLLEKVGTGEYGRI